MSSKYKDQIFEFVHQRIGFVDAEIKVDEKTIKKVKSENKTEAPFIIDKKGGFEDREHYQEYPVSETGAFILRFVLEKVPADLIAQIYKSHYGGSLEAAAGAVDGFIDKLKNLKLLKPAKLILRDPEKAEISDPKQFLGLHLDFSVGLNPMNYYKIKYPT